MCDEWMPVIDLPIDHQQFSQLPRNSAFKYEYYSGKCRLTPRPKHYHALHDLTLPATDMSPAISPIQSEDMESLAAIFSGSFAHIQPFGSLDDDARQLAARQVLMRTWSGGDGPWLRQASFTARDEGRILGSIWITLLPDGDPTDWDSFYWREPPPADCVERRLGRPHLTWIFVAPLRAGQGLGTALLAASLRALGELGYSQLASTFMLGNDSSMLWHWRTGFRLLAYPGSARRFVP